MATVQELLEEFSPEGGSVPTQAGRDIRTYFDSRDAPDEGAPYSGPSYPVSTGLKAVYEKELKKAGFSPRAIATAMGIAEGETGGFQSITENARYTTPERLSEVFGLKPKDAKRIAALPARQQYDALYGQKLGNNGEGFKYRGRGFVQVTGRDNYAALDQQLGLKGRLVKDPDMLSRNPALAAKASATYLRNRAGGTDFDIEQGLRAVGGSQTSWGLKRAKYQEYLPQYGETSQRVSMNNPSMNELLAYYGR